MHRLLVPFTLVACTPALGGDCTSEEVKIDSFVKGGSAFICVCFVPGEEVMTILDTPAGGTVTLTNIQIGWQSNFGGQPDVLEAAITVYDMNQAGPANPATFTPLCPELEGCILPGPVLSDGFLNDFNVDAFDIELPENRFGISLEFLNANSGNIFAPSVVSDTNGHNNAGGVIRNWVNVIPGGWMSSQDLGVSGDWVLRAIVEVCDAQAPCPWDLNGNAVVDTPDLLALLGQWGFNPGGPPDFDNDGTVGVTDLLKLLGVWGPCP